MALYVTITTILGILALVAVALAAALGFTLATPSGRVRLAERLVGHERHPIGWALVVALIAMSGSLYFSEVVHLVPCSLCWYQRIALYPLVIIIGCGIVMRDSRMRNYALPFCLIGLAISIYHNLVYYRIIPESLAPCAQGIPCTSRQLELFGFVTIPLMSLAAFVGMALCLLFYKSRKEGERHA